MRRFRIWGRIFKVEMTNGGLFELVGRGKDAPYILDRAGKFRTALEAESALAKWAAKNGASEVPDERRAAGARPVETQGELFPQARFL